MADVQVHVSPGGSVNRVEVIIRIFWVMIVGIVFYFFMLAAYVLMVVNFFTCLILAKRIAPIFLAKIVEQATKILAYALYITDERPPIIPEL
jgi:hypothetical protein